MTSLVVALLLTAEPLIVVAPFEVASDDPSDAHLGRAFASLVEADLKAAGVPLRTEDDLDSKNWGKIKGASHLVTGTIVKLRGQLKIVARMIATPDAMIGSAAIKNEWNGRLPIARLVLKGLHKPVPAGLIELKVEEALLRAWGDALAEGDPATAKKKVADVVKRWPAFTPAKDRLAQL